MERRRLAVVLAGLVLVGGAVTALRLSGSTVGSSTPPPPPPIPTAIKPYTAVGVLAPQPGDHPDTPAHLTLTAGPHRLLAMWNAVPGAAGYEVTWGSGDTRLVGEPDAELNGLSPGAATRVEVRAVDAFGQRSGAADATGKAQGDGPAGADNALVDHFDGAQVPDPRLWRLASPAGCAQASKGTGADSDRMVILSQCGRGSTTLRARTPFRLNTAAPDGELGRFTIDTEAPGETGELDLDLVPGPVDMVDGSTNDQILASPPNIATSDDYLPPDTIRVRIGAETHTDTGRATGIVAVTAGPNTPRVPVRSLPLHALPAPRTGVTVRWDVVLRTDGIQVLRDGQLVASGDVVPGWTSATALAEFSGSPFAPLDTAVSMIGFGGAPTGATPVAIGPTLHLDTFVTVTPGASTTAITSTDTGPGSGQLRFTVQVAPNTPSGSLIVNGAPPTFLVEIGNATFTAVPAVPGQPLLPNVRYPLVAQLPASVLHGTSTEIGVSMDVPTTYPGEADLLQTDLEVVPGPNTRPSAADNTATNSVVPVPPQLASLSARVLDANGNPVGNGHPLPRGRAVLEVTMDAVAGQRLSGTLAGVAGLAGFEVWLDNDELVAVPTAADGPGIAGVWRIAFDPSQASGAQHVIDVRAYGAQHGIAFSEAFTNFALAAQ